MRSLPPPDDDPNAPAEEGTHSPDPELTELTGQGVPPPGTPSGSSPTS
jgi:hypothetical protein